MRRVRLCRRLCSSLRCASACRGTWLGGDWNDGELVTARLQTASEISVSLQIRWVRWIGRYYTIIHRYSVFTINVPLAVRFATISIGTRKAESPEYGRFDRDLQ